MARREGGAALLVAMVLVLVSTLIGVSVMEGSGIETRLVTNGAIRQSAFHAAEAASERALLAVDAGQLTAGPCEDLDTPSVDTRVAIDARACHEGFIVPLGYSTGRFKHLLYAVSAEAATGTPATRRTVTQGAKLLVPK